MPDLATARRSVVKIFTHSDAPDYDQPWQTQGPESSFGSGSIVSTKHGLRVLTNAHVVENQAFVEVRRFGKASKFVAQVEGVGHVCDLAVLTIEDESFFDGTEPISIGDLPLLGDRVTVLGYPIGGDRLSLTEGVVSRIEISAYAQSQRRLLAVQIDAAINSGNSGGPVVDQKGKIVGVAFQASDEGQNIGYMIGAPVVDHFLRDMEDGTFDGFPDLGVVTQSLESPAFRRFLGVPKEIQGGIVVVAAHFGGSAHKLLHKEDVLLEVDGRKIGSDGSVRFRKGERIDFSHIVAQRHVGEELELVIWRKRERMNVNVPLLPPRRLVAENRYDIRPSYFTYAGLLFVPLSRDYLQTWGEDWWSSAPRNLVALYEHGIPTRGRLEVVVLQKVLADEVNQGYHGFESQVVVRTQGKRVRDLRHLISIVEATKDEFLRFELASGERLVVERALAEKRGRMILKRYGLPRERSEDLLEPAPRSRRS